ncbi:Lrp/AsnC family transcriptional regulator [Marinovum sp. 2_MG-2023]|uniref:Lrp/AsnC family transcriptional regulator n=1 Tax=Roseobacteraceae TaxID=2854170 RepID=UPI001FD222E1|nr:MULTISPECIES: Lrp/AsnC family transcriptional regulator [Roseobacteraceae]MCJ7873808.1 Lrp/AsnC family transcriptional regulator [Phaeobacter sp. J2-8]MDO6731089.1 Lrp/AsnC family transcriptional regulator [Marinovum sp. 2_MG-2023]MDO6778586.1 Lrp/AsnC family transcriptional regulator [Marinovum sp. 1_MG-2023]
MTLTVDDTDRRILQLLQTDGKASVQDIAAKVALSTSPCWRRIKRMEEAGLITGYTARLNPKLLGLHALAYVFVSLMDHREDTIAAFSRLVDTQERIIECASVTGESDYILKIAARDPEDLDHFLMRGILSSGLVRASHTHFVLRRTKPTSPWPLL